jgi:glutathione S-transferase
MIELIQFPWSPFCLVQRRILDYAGVSYKTTNIPNADRALVWRLSRGRYYGVPLLREGRTVVFETDDDSQVLAKYLETRLQLGLFPSPWEGVQDILWRYIENDVEGLGFRLNDIYAREFVPAKDWVGFLRHKERKFGRGCLDQWRRQQPELLSALAQKLMPFERMLQERDFLLDGQPRFVDFDLFGVLANFLFSGHYHMPESHPQLQTWYERMSSLRRTSSIREKLHSRHQRPAA